MGYSKRTWEPEENCGHCKVHGLCILFASLCTIRKPNSVLKALQLFPHDVFFESSPYVLQDAIAEYHRKNEIPQAPTADAASAASAASTTADGDTMSSDDEAYDCNGTSSSDDDSEHGSAAVGGSSKDAVAGSGGGGGGGGDDSDSSSGVGGAEDAESGSDSDGDEGPIKRTQRKRAGINYTCLNYMLYGVDNVCMPAYSPTIMLKLVRMSAARLMQHPLALQKNQAKLKEEEEADSDYEGA